VANLLAAGYGKWELTTPTQEGGPSIGTFFLSFREMEAMGEENRVRLGVQSSYEFALAHPPSPPNPEQNQ